MEELNTEQPIVASISGHAAGTASMQPKAPPVIAYISGHATSVRIRQINEVTALIAKYKAEGTEITREEAAKELGFIKE